MKPIHDILSTASLSPKHIVLPEGDDHRIIRGATSAVDDGLAKITLLGDQGLIEKSILSNGASPKSFNIINPVDAHEREAYAKTYYELRKHKGVTLETAYEKMHDKLNFAAMMVHKGDADGTVAGAAHPTTDVIRAALQIIGTAPGTKIVSSFFIILLCDEHHTKKGAFVFADCGLNIDPNSQKLCEIAIDSADSCKSLLKSEPRVAMLSFSTDRSAKHKNVEQVAKAAQLVKERRPDLKVSGDIQFDAAFVPEVSAIKIKDSPLEGNANVMIFPNLDAANIGYKIAQRIGGAKAIGPILQGLAKPANDLSRGCDEKDVYNLIAITSLQATHASNV